MRVVITGASRGIGAAAARTIAADCHDVAVGYYRHAKRARRVLGDALVTAPGSVAIQANLATGAGISEFCDQIEQQWNEIDALVLSASGGLETKANVQDLITLNSFAPVELARRLAPRLQFGHVVYLTSHPAHFFGVFPCPIGYDPVARTKETGEGLLRELVESQPASGFDLTVISADLVIDSMAARLLEYENPGLAAARSAVNPYPVSARTVATEIHRTITAPHRPNDKIVFVAVGSTEGDLEVTGSRNTSEGIKQ